jgi:hypothetical protein
MRNARPALNAVAVIGRFARREECFPRNARWIIDPRFFRLGVAARRLPLLDNVATGLVQTAVDLAQFFLALDLNPKMVKSGLSVARRNCKVHAGIIKHPLCIVGLDYGGLRFKHRRIEPDRVGDICDRNMDVHSLHDTDSFVRTDTLLRRLDFAGSQRVVGAHFAGDPRQQFSVR